MVKPRHQPLIIGSGNIQFRDDGVGVHALRLLQADPPPDVMLLNGGTDVFAALPYIEQTDQVLLIDAVRHGREPGTMRVFDGYAMPYELRSPTGFEISVPELLLSLAPHTRPRLFCVLGIEPADTSLGTSLSPVVRAMLPKAVETAIRMAHRWTESEPWFTDAELAT